MIKLHKYIVEGAYAGHNDGSPITSDWVLARNENEAREIVEKVREATDPWHFDSCETFAEYIAGLKRHINTLRRATNGSVLDAWYNTLDALGFAGQCDVCHEPLDEVENVYHGNHEAGGPKCGGSFCDTCMEQHVKTCKKCQKQFPDLADPLAEKN